MGIRYWSSDCKRFKKLVVSAPSFPLGPNAIDVESAFAGRLRRLPARFDVLVEQLVVGVIYLNSRCSLVSLSRVYAIEGIVCPPLFATSPERLAFLP